MPATLQPPDGSEHSLSCRAGDSKYAILARTWRKIRVPAGIFLLSLILMRFGSFRPETGWRFFSSGTVPGNGVQA